MTNRIRELRLAKGLTLEDVAEAVGTTFQTISRLETGKRKLNEGWMRRIAPALGVPPPALLSDEAPNPVQILKDPKKIRLRPEEILVIRFWRLLDGDEKRMIAAFARAKGLEILANQPKRRPA